MILILIGAGLAVAFYFKEEIVEKVENQTDAWTKYDSLFQKYGAKYSVPWTWLKAIALNESSLGAAKSVARGLAVPTDIEGSKSSDGKSWGLMQVTLTTAKGMDANATQVKLNNPEYSIDLGARYISQLSTQFSKLDNRYTEWVIKSYNQGPGNTRKEISGATSGYAGEYWTRFSRNLKRVEDSL